VVARRLAATRVTPNQVTTVSLGFGLAGAALFASGSPAAANAGACGYCLSALFDHVDGELARMTGRSSSFGHAYDRIADLIVKIAVFSGMGIGLRSGSLGGWAPVIGILAGAAFVSIFALRSELARRRGPEALRQPSYAGFEVEDILYVIAPVTWLGGLQPFVIAAAIGAPIFALRTALEVWASPEVATAPAASGVRGTAAD
jgi:phosphatidylglycerophosphate synthase